MNYAEALKKVQTKKVRENFLCFSLNYDTKVILPYKDGLAFIASLANAEQLNEPYNRTHSITEMDKTKMTFSQLSQEEYEQYKIAALLGITLDEVKEQRLLINP